MPELKNVPDFKAFFLPVLQLGNEGQTSINEAVVRVADYFDLSQEAREDSTASGRSTRVRNRTSWAVTYLVQAGLLHRPKRGYFIITKRGKDVLAQNPEKITLDFLMKFSEFQQFKTRRKPYKNDANDLREDCGDVSPEEQIELAHGEIVAAIKSELLTKILNSSPEFFEHLIIDLLVAMGYGGSRDEAGTHLGKTGDGGIDGVIAEDKLGLDVIYIQAKRYASENSVGSPDLQKFLGSLVGKGANKGVFATTSSFSKAAQDYVNSVSHRIILVDGDKLTSLMIEHDVGVRVNRAIEIKKIDDDFFEEA